MKKIFTVQDMDCASCAASIEDVLMREAPVSSVNVDIMNETVSVEYDGAAVTEDRLAGIIEQLGYTVVRKERTSGDGPSLLRFLPTFLSGVLVAAGLAAVFADSPETVRVTLFIAAAAVGGFTPFRKGLASLRSLSADMNLLMSLAIIGALALGEWAEAATATFLFSLANFLEVLSMRTARGAIEELLDLTPETALVEKDGEYRQIPVEEAEVGDEVMVKPGGRIPLDGVVRCGESHVNEAAITGESLPVFRAEGDAVYAGTINQEGVLIIGVEKGESDSKLAQIVRLVEEARVSKAPIQNFIDRFAGYYTPVVIVIALLVFVLPPLFGAGSFREWFYRGLVLLVVACPCALIIATPVAVLSGLAAGARKGILVKGGMYLEWAGKMKTVAFDKTGTLTEGSLVVKSVKIFGEKNEEKVIGIAASIESNSEHPIADAVVDYARNGDIAFVPARMFRAHRGRGAEGTVGGKRYYVGNHRFIKDLGLCREEIHIELERLEGEAMTSVVLADEEGIIAVFGIGDRIRKEAERALRELKARNIGTVMLTGDGRGAASSVAENLEIDDYRFELLPEGKVAAVEQLVSRCGFTGMVGDGVNDAPALSSASLGIAMGTAGTDIAVEAADVLIIGDDLLKLSELVDLSRATLGIIKQNVVFAFLVKLVFVILAAMGYASLWMAVGADMGASLAVIFNGLRMSGR